MNDKLLDAAQEYLKVKGVLDQNQVLQPEQRKELADDIDRLLNELAPKLKPKPKVKEYLVTAKVKVSIRSIDAAGAKSEFEKMMRFVGIESWTYEKVEAQK